MIEVIASPAVLAELAGPLSALSLLLRPTPIAPDPLPTPRSEPEQRPRPGALAQPANGTQRTDVNVIYAGPAVLRQDDQLMRVLAHQSAMDVQRSECKIELSTRRTRGEQRAWASSIRRFVFITDLIPRPEIFRIEESSSSVPVTDALAKRVLKTGCSGMQFTDPDNPQLGQRIELYRTATGIAERHVHF